MNTITLDEVRDKLEFIRKMYDAIRIVDPVSKHVIDWEGSTLAETPEICYDYWQRGKICDNCISIRAHQENRSYVKLERSPESVLMVIATPIEDCSKPLVLEMLKNATDTLLVDSGEYSMSEPFTGYTQTLNDLIVKDPCTGLYNRRYVDERLPADLVNAALGHQPLSLCFMDLDSLKSINDQLGHEYGDAAIRQTGQEILTHIRTDRDWAARYGGDEFIVCLPGADAESAQRVALRIQSGIESFSVGNASMRMPLSISFGIKTTDGGDLTASELIAAADRIMYAAKSAKQAKQA